MHRPAYKEMRHLVDEFVPTDRKLRVVDLGSGTTPNQDAARMTHTALFDDLTSAANSSSQADSSWSSTADMSIAD